VPELDCVTSVATCSTVRH